VAGLRLTIDGAALTVQSGATILEVARAAGIYIPYLCSHPDLPAVEPGTRLGRILRGPESGSDGVADEVDDGCWLCAVAVNGELMRACATPVAAAMTIDTCSKAVIASRRRRLAELLAGHPHLCSSCAQDECFVETIPAPSPSAEGIGAATLFSLIEEAFAPATVPAESPLCPCCELRRAIEPSATQPEGPASEASRDGS